MSIEDLKTLTNKMEVFDIPKIGEKQIGKQSLLHAIISEEFPALDSGEKLKIVSEFMQKPVDVAREVVPREMRKDAFSCLSPDEQALDFRDDKNHLDEEDAEVFCFYSDGGALQGHSGFYKA